MRVNFSAESRSLRINRAKAAFSVLEAVVSIAITLILVAAGITACYTAFTIQNYAINTERVCTVGDEFVRAFLFTENDGENFSAGFVSELSFALGCGEEKIGAEIGSDSVVYTYAADGVSVTAVISYCEGNRTLTVTGKTDGQNRTVYSRTAVREVLSETIGGDSNVT